MFETEVNYLKEVNRAKEYYQKTKGEKETANYACNIALINFINTINNYASIWEFLDGHIKEAQKEIYEKKKGKKVNLDYLNSKIQEELFSNKYEIKIKDIITQGYDGYGYSFRFTIEDNTYALDIPIRRRLTANNFEYAYEGQIAFLRQSSPSCWEVVARDYENDKLAEKIKEYFKVKRDGE